MAQKNELNGAELMDLFTAAIDNAMHLMEAAQELVASKNAPQYTSLGLGELALEELGKSYTCLAYYSNRRQLDWKLFWKEWRNHELKAHRAFFYEFFCLLRAEVQADDRNDYFPSYREKIPLEKEATFYVDIDRESRKIHLPIKEITTKECYYRLASLIGPMNAALKVKRLIETNKEDVYITAFSDYAFSTLTTSMYQQDVLTVLAAMKTGDETYDRALNDIAVLFTPQKQ